MKNLQTLIFLFSVQVWASAGAGQDPNIVIILADDMGYGDAGAYNANSKIQTPNLDTLARDGLRFTNAHAPAALCHPSRYGLLTGEYPFRTDFRPWRERPLIGDKQVTIASLLQSNGYRTAMVGKWHLGFHENGYDQPLRGGPVDRGFDSFFGIRASTDIPPYFYIRGDRAVTPPSGHIEANASEGWSPIQGAFWREGGIAPDLKLEEVLPRFTAEAVRVIDEHHASGSDKPLMLYLAYPAPHTPWLPSAEFTGQSGAGMYGDFTMMVDAMIGRVLEALDRAGMRENTLVIFSSDNGPVWYAPDVEKYGHDSSGGLRGMKGDAWEAGHRMPFIVRWPGTVSPGTTSERLVCFTDLLATFAAIVGAELPGEAGPDSFSFLDALEGGQAGQGPVRESLVTVSARGALAIQKDGWKYIDRLGSGGFSDRLLDPESLRPAPGRPTAQLYHLAEDLAESWNLFL
ncbi:MAG: sulfatase-like hydrolase/transferase, partial [Xanthomonadales bacterium]|nr:arylsulfatase [Xanthomonadales bacterium]NIX13404.1 sulfatase-like hydrolase/transferase [Xanthomonadales bacterium]